MSGSAERLLALARSRPTLVAQAVSALGSLLLVTVLTRELTTDDFGTYSAVIATYALGVAMVGTTIGTRAIEALSQGRDSRISLAGARDGLTVLGCALAAGATTLITGSSALVFVLAGAGMLGMIIDQLAGSYLLGLQRFWQYAGLVAVRMSAWVLLLVVLVFEMPEDQRLAGAFLATSASALIPLIYLLACDGIAFTWKVIDQHRLPVSAVGVANLALWLLASADRVILAHYALTALATYAALYGLLDRVFRGMANAEIQRRLPQAFADHSTGTLPIGRLTGREALGILVLGIAAAGLGPPAVDLISGGNYDPPYWMAISLTGAMVAMVCAVPSYVSLIARGRARLAAYAAVVPAAVNLAGNFLLASRYGTTSAALLTLGGYLLWLVGVLYADRRLATRGDVG